MGFIPVGERSGPIQVVSRIQVGSNLTAALARHPSKNLPGSTELNSPRLFGIKALKTSSNFSPPTLSAIFKSISSTLDQLPTLISESISAAVEGMSVSNVIFRTRVEVTVRRIGSIQWLGRRSWMRLSCISSMPLHGDKSINGFWKISSKGDPKCKMLRNSVCRGDQSHQKKSCTL